MGCIAFAIVGLFMPPGALDAQHGVSIIQSIMQFIGHAQQAGHIMHGLIIGSMHAIG